MKLKLSKKTAFIMLSVICISSSYGISNAERKILSVPQQKQQWTNTCWASGASMVSAYLKRNSTNYESKIFRYIKGSIDGNSTNARGSVADSSKGVKYITGISGSAKVDTPSYAAIQHQIKNNGPVISGLIAKSHAIVIKGFDTKDKSVLYNDPATGKGHSATYGYLTNSNNKMKTFAFWK